MRQIFLSLLTIITLLSFFPHQSKAEESYRAQDISHMIEVLGLSGQQTDAEVLQTAKDLLMKNGTLACRKDGFSCRSSIECCSYCMSGACGGRNYQKPDGASCKSSIECKSYCMSGVCGGQNYNKPDGAECKSSIECKTYCMSGRCGGV